MPIVKAEFLGTTHHRIIRHPIKFLGLTVGYRKELKLETFAEGLKRIQEEIGEVPTHYSKIFKV